MRVHRALTEMSAAERLVRKALDVQGRIIRISMRARPTLVGEIMTELYSLQAVVERVERLVHADTQFFEAVTEMKPKQNLPIPRLAPAEFVGGRGLPISGKLKRLTAGGR